MRLVIFGSGDVLEGFSPRRGVQQLVDFTKAGLPRSQGEGNRAGATATIATRGEFAVGNNFISTVSDALRVIRAWSRLNVRC